MNQHLKSTKDVIERLGGTKAVAELFGVTVNAVSMWRTEGLFPPHTYLAMTRKLHSIGYAADISLWKFSDPQSSHEIGDLPAPDSPAHKPSESSDGDCNHGEAAA